MSTVYCGNCKRMMGVTGMGRCALCGELIKDELGSAKKPAQSDRFAQAAIDADAQIAWGHPRERVMRKLIDQGIPFVTARRLVDEACAARASGYRARGIGLTIVGGVTALIAFGVVVVVDLTWKLFLPAALFGTIGLLMFIPGVVYLVRGGEGEGSMTDMLED